MVPPVEDVKPVEAIQVVEPAVPQVRDLAEVIALAAAVAPAIQQEAAELASWFVEQAALAQVFPIQTQEDLELAAEAVKLVKARLAFIEDRQKALTKPLKNVTDTVRSWFAPAAGHGKLAESAWKQAIQKSHQVRVEQATAAAQAAQQAHAAGDPASVAASVALIQPPEPVAGLSTYDRWDFTVLALDLLPREYLMADTAKIREHMKHRDESGEPLPIPGVKFYKRPITVVRTG